MSEADIDNSTIQNKIAKILPLIDTRLRLAALVVLVTLSVLTTAFYSVDADNAVRGWYPIAALVLFALIVLFVCIPSRGKKASPGNVQTTELGENARGGAFANTSGNFDFSVTTTYTGPTAGQELMRADLEKAKSILNQFDRAAVNDLMHEEIIGMMIQSLDNLRVEIQKLGKSTLADRELRESIGYASRKVEQIIEIASALSVFCRVWQNSIFDMRMFNGLNSEFKNSSNGSSRLANARTMIEGRVAERFKRAIDIDHIKARDIMSDYIQWKEHKDDVEKMQPDEALDVATLADDFTIFYAFGILDQAKEDVRQAIQIANSRIDTLIREIS